MLGFCLYVAHGQWYDVVGCVVELDAIQANVVWIAMCGQQVKLEDVTGGQQCTLVMFSPSTNLSSVR